jgi:hypothetical protein
MNKVGQAYIKMNFANKMIKYTEFSFTDIDAMDDNSRSVFIYSCNGTPRKLCKTLNRDFGKTRIPLNV